MSRAKLVLAVAALALFGVVAIAGVAGAANRATTIVTIKGPNGDFQGRVKSDRKGCLGGRTVKVFKQKGDRQNPTNDKVIAKDTSERDGDHGVWSVGNTGFKRGDFYAKVTRTDACKGDYSNTISL